MSSMPRRVYLCALISIVAGASISKEAAAADQVAGNLILYNDNGAFCWFQDERVIIDSTSGKMLIGSVANGAGTGGASRSGDVELTTFDLTTRTRKRFTLANQLQDDDHNAPALMIRPDGRYLVGYTTHNAGPALDSYSRFRISTNAHDSSAWGSEQTFNWNTAASGFTTNSAYTNLFHLSAENRTYNFVRAVNKDPSMLTSTDQGATWSYAGPLLQRPQLNGSYNNGYFKYASNNVDKIWFVGTEHHPRDYNTSIYAGYIQNGKMYKSDGTLVDGDIFSSPTLKQEDLTLVVAANTTFAGVSMKRFWTMDLHVDATGKPYTVFNGRANDNENDHRFFYARFDGSQWQVNYLAKAGAKLYNSEQDYTGLVAIHPNDPNTLYMSTSVDPATNTALAKHEIYKGITGNGGQTWAWTALTKNSTVDNLRPTIASWDASSTALTWFRGTMTTSQSYDFAVVGIVDQNVESVGLVHYVDASMANTTRADGLPLSVTGPSANKGAADGLWHWRSGVGNGGSVLASGELDIEDAPTLKTTLTGLSEGTHDVFAFFWANPSEDWRIRAGLSLDDMQVSRAAFSQQAELVHFDGPITISDTTVALYRAYLGRVQVVAGQSVDVFIDDAVGSSGGTRRTWYDGLGYAAVTPTAALPTYAGWRSTHFPPADPRGAPEANPDHDALNNTLEYAVNGNPLLPDAAVMPADTTVVVAGQPHLAIRYRQRTGGIGKTGVDYQVDDLTYRVGLSTSLQPNSWQTGDAFVEPEGSAVVNGDGTETVTVRAEAPIDTLGPGAFLRLEITLDP